MKIAHFIDTNAVGGAEVLVVEICRGLNKHHQEGVVLHFGNKWIEQQCDKLGIQTYILPGHNSYKSIKTIPFFALSLWNFLRKSNIDIIHSHLIDPIIGACLGTFLSRIPHVGTLHDIYTLIEQPGKLRLLQIAVALGTQVVTVSTDIEKHIRQKIKFPNDACQTIYNGVDLKRFSPSAEMKTETRKRLSLTQHDFVFICVGRLVEVKDHATLLLAFSMCQFDSHVKLLIVGDGPLRPSIEKTIATLQINNQVKMLGLRNDIPDLLSISDCFVLASLSEGHSCSIIEAMAAGLPVVATKVGGNPELIQNESTGYLVPSSDPLSMAKKLKHIYKENTTRHNMGIFGQTIASKMYSLDTMLDAYLSVYHNAMNKKGRQR